MLPKPYFQDEAMTIYNADCREVMAKMPENSVDAVVTDPPYGLEFMGKEWDKLPGGFHGAWSKEALRVLKPGGHMLVAGIGRTHHRMMVAVEDAGFEVRDCIYHLFGTGFPKSADISKHIDRMERDKWLKVCKAIDIVDKTAILEAWKGCSENVKPAGIAFQKSPTEVGINMPKNCSAPVIVLLRASPENSDVSAIIAELVSREVPHTSGEFMFSARFDVEDNTMVSNVLVTTVANSQENPAVTCMESSFVQYVVWEYLSESIMASLKGVEALRIWLGNAVSLKQEATTALSAALTEDLKRIILNQSEIFQSYDTVRQMDCVSATIATITESTAESLISFMVDTLRSKAIDKAAGAKRRIRGTRVSAYGTDTATGGRVSRIDGGAGLWKGNDPKVVNLTEGAIMGTAKQWEGWGTALKPAAEVWVLFRKPLSEKTVAANVLRWGTGGLNIDGCRIPTEPRATGTKNPHTPSGVHGIYGSDARQDRQQRYDANKPNGRWPANVILDESAVEELDAQSGIGNSKASLERYGRNSRVKYGTYSGEPDKTKTVGFTDSGGASRFFYIAKAAKVERLTLLHCNCETVKLEAWVIKQDQNQTDRMASTSPPKGTSGGPSTDDSECNMIGSGCKPTDQSQKDIASTTRTGTSKTTDSKTSGSSHSQTTSEFMGDANLEMAPGGSPVSSAKGSSPLPQSIGTSPQRDGHSTGVVVPATSKLLSGKRVCVNCGTEVKAESHPTQKPLKLMTYLCRLITPPGGVVLDPFLGSGTTILAARLEGFRSIGVEMSLEYIEIAAKRMSQTVLAL